MTHLRTYHQFLVSRELGGAGLIALNVGRFLREESRDAVAWVPGSGPARHEAERIGLPIEEYNAEWGLGDSRLRAGLCNWRVGRCLRRHGPGIAHVHGPHYYGAFRRGLAWGRVQRVVHIHLDEHPDGLRWAFKQPPQLIVTCARFLVDHVRQCIPEPVRERQWIEAVPNAVDTARFSPGDKARAKQQVGAPEHRPMVLMLANLAPHKGQETAIRAVADLKSRGVEVECWLAGVERDGVTTYQSHLRQLIRDTGVADRVRLLGQRADAPELLRAADFFLLPSTREGLPLSLLEAQATKVPVLAAPTAGVPEVVRDGETGFLVAADNPVGYAERVQTLLGNAEQCRTVAERAYAHTVREHNWPAYCRKIVDLYDELVRRADERSPRADLAHANGAHEAAPCSLSRNTSTRQ